MRIIVVYFVYYLLLFSSGVNFGNFDSILTHSSRFYMSRSFDYADIYVVKSRCLSDVVGSPWLEPHKLVPEESLLCKIHENNIHSYTKRCQFLKNPGEVDTISRIMCQNGFFTVILTPHAEAMIPINASTAHRGYDTNKC